MLSGAVVCSACTRHQSRFWNTAPNISLLFALVAAIFSGALFIYAQSAKIVAEHTWQDEAEIWKLESIGESFIRNTGDGDVFVSHIELRGAPLGQNIEIGRIVKKGAVEGKKSGFNPFPNGSFRPLSQEELADGLAPDSYVYLSENSATLVSWRALLTSTGKTLSEIPAKATLDYYSLKDNTALRSEAVSIAVPLFGID